MLTTITLWCDCSARIHDSIGVLTDIAVPVTHQTTSARLGKTICLKSDSVLIKIQSVVVV